MVYRLVSGVPVMAEFDHLSRANALLEEAQASDAYANKVSDPVSKENFQRMAGYWRDLAQMRARLAPENSKVARP
jgi:hypothetical protein